MLFETVISNIKSSNNQARKLTKTILNMQNFHFIKITSNTKKLNSEEKIAENANTPKESWQTLKSLGTPSKGGDNLKYH